MTTTLIYELRTFPLGVTPLASLALASQDLLAEIQPPRRNAPPPTYNYVEVKRGDRIAVLKVHMYPNMENISLKVPSWCLSLLQTEEAQELEIKTPSRVPPTLALVEFVKPPTLQREHKTALEECVKQILMQCEVVNLGMKLHAPVLGINYSVKIARISSDFRKSYGIMGGNTRVMIQPQLEEDQ